MAAPEHMEITKMKHKGTRISDMRSWYDQSLNSLG